MKVFDIVAPKDDWGRNYAHMEYMRIVWHDLWQPTTYIEVKTLSICKGMGEELDNPICIQEGRCSWFRHSQDFFRKAGIAGNYPQNVDRFSL